MIANSELTKWEIKMVNIFCMHRVFPGVTVKTACNHCALENNSGCPVEIVKREIYNFDEEIEETCNGGALFHNREKLLKERGINERIKFRSS